jgi:hypothetical protein
VSALHRPPSGACHRLCGAPSRVRLGGQTSVCSPDGSPATVTGSPDPRQSASRRRRATSSQNSGATPGKSGSCPGTRTGTTSTGPNTCSWYPSSLGASKLALQLGAGRVEPESSNETEPSWAPSYGVKGEGSTDGRVLRPLQGLLNVASGELPLIGAALCSPEVHPVVGLVDLLLLLTGID